MPANPWVVEPVWTAFSSFHCEMRLAETAPNDFVRNHHRVAALYFAITSAEAQINESIRTSLEKSGVDDEEIGAKLRGLRFKERFTKFRQLFPPSTDNSEPSWQVILRTANTVRNELTHRKNKGYEAYDALSALDLSEVRLAVVEICILAAGLISKPYPYWLTGWNFVQRGNPHEFCIRLDSYQLKVCLQQFGFQGLPRNDPLGHGFYDAYLRTITGFKSLIQFMDDLNHCRPFDSRFPFTPVLCRKWWDTDHVAAGCPD